MIDRKRLLTDDRYARAVIASAPDAVLDRIIEDIEATPMLAPELEDFEPERFDDCA